MITLHFHLQPQYEYELFHIKLYIVDIDPVESYLKCGVAGDTIQVFSIFHVGF